MTQSTVTTEIFRTKASTYMRIVLSRWLKHNSWWLVLPPLICVALAVTVSVTFIFVALIMVFLLYPMSMMIVYFNYALSPEVCAEMSPHRVTFTDCALTIDYMNCIDKNDDQPVYIVARSVEIPYNCISGFSNTDASILIFTDRRGYRLHYIPTTAMTQESRESVSPIISKISSLN